MTWMRSLPSTILFAVACAGTDERSSKGPPDAARVDARSGDSGGGQSGTGGESGGAGDGGLGTGGASGNGGGGGTTADAGMGDASLDGAGRSDGEAGVAIATLSGHTLDAFGGTAVAMTNVTTSTSQGPVTVTSDEGGAYAIELRVGEVFSPVAAHAQYRATRNPTQTITSSATFDLELVSISDATRQYTQLGLVASAGTAVVFVNLRSASGSALVGIPASDIQLLDENDQPVGGVRGPFFFGVSGELVSSVDLATSISVAGRARAGFLDCPPGTYRLEVTVALEAGATVLNAPVTCDAGGATLVATGD